jgi:RNA recognition motif-containing protein
VKTLKEKFRNFWVEDRKIKLKTSEELGYESFDHRTIIVRNIPTHLKSKQLIEIFTSFGALVNIELPSKNIAIEEEIKNKLDVYSREKKEKREVDTRRA